MRTHEYFPGELLVSVSQPGAPTRTVVTSTWPCRIGRDRECEVVLAGWRVARLHAHVTIDDGVVQLKEFGARAGLSINGQRLSGVQSITSADLIDLAGYRLQISRRLHSTKGGEGPKTLVAARGGGDVSPLCGIETAQRLGTQGIDAVDAEVSAAQGSAAICISQFDDASGLTAADVAREDTGQAIAVPASIAVETLAWRRRLHREVLGVLDLRRQDLQQAAPEALRSEIRAALQTLLSQSIRLPEHLNQEQMIADVLDEAVGLGALESLLKDASVSEIMINAPDEIWVERSGRLQRHAGGFSDADAVRSIIDRIVAPLGRRIDESSPMVDARLPDGSRLNAVIPPLALRGPAVTIRRFSRKLVRPEDLVELGAASAQMMDFLTVCVEHRRNIVISGGTSSGKTTLLNVLSNLIPEGERIVTIEDAAELSLRHAHLVQLEGRPGNLEARGEVSIRDLVRNALRMRPDRIVVGECRGGETLDMLQAMNTGHDGSLTTVHANSPRDVVSRLEVMTLMAGMELPVQAIREQIAAAVDVIVHQARFADGSRRITHITEVTGIESGRVQMQPIFEFRMTSGQRGSAVRGVFEACDTVPTFYEGLREAGVAIELGAFQKALESEQEVRP